MNQILRQGQYVSVGTSGLACRVEQFLGGGGQGEVYRASIGGQSLALKWYFPHSATPEQLDALTILVEKGPADGTFSVAAGHRLEQRDRRLRLHHAAARPAAIPAWWI